MLVLTRKVNQSIVIGEGIEVVVLEVRGEQVRLGIKAPDNVTVYRKDIFDSV
jgi:carbon storage regulator